MARVHLLEDSELSAEALATVKTVEQTGGDASVLRATAHCEEMFNNYFRFYYPAHQGGIISPDLKELVRLKIARLNDCFT
jgi:alkylhydroperoxidase family enzyme